LWRYDGAADVFLPVPPGVGTWTSLHEGPTPKEKSCCANLGGPDGNGDGFCDPDPSMFTTPGWRLLDFTIRGAHQYSYSFDENGTGQLGGTMYTATATADLDCDGEPAKFVMKAGFGARCGNTFEFPSSCSPEDFFSLMGIPSFTYVSESGLEWPIPADWVETTILGRSAQQSSHSIFKVSQEETYYVRKREPIHYLVQGYLGAARYYGIKKIMQGAPACQVDPEDQAVMDKYPGKFPDYLPLVQGLTPMEGSCCLPLGGPDKEKNGLCDADWDVWSTATWGNLGVRLLSEHAYMYEFDETPVEGDKFTFRMTALGDPDCSGSYEKLVLTGDVSNEDGTCIVKDPDWKVGSNARASLSVAWFPIAAEETAITIPLWRGKGVWQGDDLGLLMYPGLYCLCASDSAFAVAYREPYENIQRVMDALGVYYEKNCGIPPEPVPELPIACPPTVDGMRDPDMGYWDEPFWTELAFRMPVPFRYGYHVESDPLPDGKQMIRVEAYGDTDCHSQNSSMERVGIAEGSAGSCSIQWLKGWSIHHMND